MKLGALVIATSALAALACLGWFGLYRSAERAERATALVARMRSIARLDDEWRIDVARAERGDTAAAERLVASVSELTRLNDGCDRELVPPGARAEFERASETFGAELLARSELARRFQTGLSTCRGARLRLAIDLDAARADEQLRAFAADAEVLAGLETIFGTDAAPLDPVLLAEKRDAP